MTYAIEVTSAAAQALLKLSRQDMFAVKRKIDALADDPRPHRVEKLSGMRDTYRVRVGNYRIVYTIDDRVRIVSVIRVAHRREVYRRL